MWECRRTRDHHGRRPPYPERVRGEADIRRGRWAFGLTVTAFTWALTLVVAALVVPVYSGEQGGSASGTVTMTSTLVAQNGLGVLVPVALPAAIAALVWLALYRKCAYGSRGAASVAWALVGVLTAFCLLAILSIGAFVLPVAALLSSAAALTPLASSPAR
jgi:hypothetical protein